MRKGVMTQGAVDNTRKKKGKSQNTCPKHTNNKQQQLNRAAVEAAFAGGGGGEDDQDGIEDAFELVAEVPEKIRYVSDE